MRIHAVLLAAALLTSPALARVHLPGESSHPVEPRAAAPDPTGFGVEARYGAFGGFVAAGGLALTWSGGAWQAGLVAYRGSADLTGAAADALASNPALAGQTLDSLTVAATQYTVEGRFLLPFYDLTAATGVGWRRLRGHVATSAKDGSGTFSSDAVVTNLVASAAIGNVWRWPRGFFLGVDWLGVETPLTSGYAVSGHGTGANFEALMGEASALARTLGRSPAIILFLAAAGYRF